MPKSPRKAPLSRPTSTPSEHGGERVAKVLARAGIASRRDSERIIEAGRVAVNGARIASPALNVTPSDVVTVDGKPLEAPERPRLWLYHKPAGLVTTARDERGRRTVFDELPPDLPRVLSVGRLDINSEGLLLLTNDGEIKRRLELPSTGWLRRYRVRVRGRPTDAALEPLRQGIEVEGERFRPMTATLDRQRGANAWLTVGLREGRNREIRRAMSALGFETGRLIRVSYGPFQLGALPVGSVSEIRPSVLRDQLGIEIGSGAGTGTGSRMTASPGSGAKAKGAGTAPKATQAKPRSVSRAKGARKPARGSKRHVDAEKAGRERREALESRGARARTSSSKGSSKGSSEGSSKSSSRSSPKDTSKRSSKISGKASSKGNARSRIAKGAGNAQGANGSGPRGTSPSFRGSRKNAGAASTASSGRSDGIATPAKGTRAPRTARNGSAAGKSRDSGRGAARGSAGRTNGAGKAPRRGGPKTKR